MVTVIRACGAPVLVVENQPRVVQDQFAPRVHFQEIQIPRGRGFIRIGNETPAKEIESRTFPFDKLPDLCREMKIQGRIEKKYIRVYIYQLI